MKEEKNCSIDIVEIDSNAGLEASQYANMACIGSKDGDINTQSNVEYYQTEKVSVAVANMSWATS